MVPASIQQSYTLLKYSIMQVQTTPVSVFVAVTVTPGIKAPVVSVTVPLMVPPCTSAKRVLLHRRLPVHHRLPHLLEQRSEGRHH